MPPKVLPFTVIAELPESLQPLRTIASNLWWTWDHRAKSLFYRMVPGRYAKLGNNPIALINSLSKREVQQLEENQAFVAEIQEVQRIYRAYATAPSWWQSHSASYTNSSIAYFSAEFGLHESLQVYSGGLGVLAGDFLKAGSDLGIPLVGVGLLYHEGYFHQYLNADGWQQEAYPQIEVINLPIQPVNRADGSRAVISVRVENHDVFVQGWAVDVGRVKLYLLDTNIDANEPIDRTITARLYGGDIANRIKQEMVLGVGGLRLLKEIGVQPNVCHMNEGHSAFLALEQIRVLMKEQSLTFDQALAGAKATNIFTTHTPVPAGNDVFHKDIVSPYFAPFVEEYKVPLENVLALGRSNLVESTDWFSMTVLALRTSAAANGVSKLHSVVSRKMWQNLWPDLPLDEVPIDHVTNGIHTTTWSSRDISQLYDQYLGPDWIGQTHSPEVWARISQMPDEELWRILCRRRSILATFCREKLSDNLVRRGVARSEIESAKHVLDPDALTIGFARRFAAYKRANLMLRDLDRLTRLVGNRDRPVQFVFAGKAHPADQAGKQLIAEIIHVARKAELRGRFVFIEDYDMGIARKLLQGVDVWLNTPRRPLEASGTSGMKAAANGVLNMSVLDGWWAEGYDHKHQNGWSIGQGEEYPDPNYQDEVESRAIYDLLEREIIPTFYDRSYDDVPRAWVAMVKQTIKSNAPGFSASRMVIDYAKKFYVPRIVDVAHIQSSKLEVVKKRSADIHKFKQNWNKLKVLKVDAQNSGQFAIKKNLPISVTVQLGAFAANEIAVEVYHGPLDVTSIIHESAVTRLQEVEVGTDGGVVTYSGAIKADHAGTFGFSIRVVPIIEGEPKATVPGLILWWQ